MMKYIVLLLSILVLHEWSSIRNFINPLPDFAAAHNGKVILYATSWCSYCEEARVLLEDNEIDYFEYDIEKSQKGNTQHKRLGGNGIPVLLINGEVINGYDPARIVELARTE